MYVLVFILASPGFVGDFFDLASCQSAIHEIYATQANPPGKRLQELEESINIRVSLQKSYICIPKKKG